jgi:hypothetical protein
MEKLVIRKIEDLKTTAGMPALHGVDGRTFGAVVSGLATTNPIALAAHVSGK